MLNGYPCLLIPPFDHRSELISSGCLIIAPKHPANTRRTRLSIRKQVLEAQVQARLSILSGFLYRRRPERPPPPA